MNKQNSLTVRILYSAICLTLCMLLPFLTGQIPQLGNMFLPMHLPVFLCGFLCGWPWGLVVGLLAPILRFVIFGMPILFPTGIAMAVELAAYGVLAAVFYRLFPKKLWGLYLALLLAMIGGRLIWGAVYFALVGFSQTSFPFSVFLANGFVNGLPGVFLQLLLLPTLVWDMQKITHEEKE